MRLAASQLGQGEQNETFHPRGISWNRAIRSGQSGPVVKAALTASNLRLPVLLDNASHPSNRAAKSCSEQF